MEKIKQLLIAGGAGAAALAETTTRAFNDLFSRQVLNSAALAVSGTTTLFKTVNTINAVIGGVSVLKATADFPALTGYNLTSGQIGGFLATMDVNGTLFALPIGPAAALGQIVYPMVPLSQVVIGTVLINAVNPVTFTGGTTLMSATSVTYINQVGPFYPTNAF